MASTQNEIPRVVYHPLGSDLRRVFIVLEAAINKPWEEEAEQQTSPGRGDRNN
jgi:hypothetical protein